MEATTPVAGRRSLPLTSARYRIGDVCLAVVSDHAPLQEALVLRYAECATGVDPLLTQLSCTATRGPDAEWLGITWEGAAPPDPMEIVKGLYRPARIRQSHVEEPADAGSRCLVDRERDRRLLLVHADGGVEINLREATEGFIVDYLIATAHRVQPQNLFLHAAAVGVRGRGALIVGGSGTGKTTLALAMAARGHAVLCDDVAAARLSTGELLPFREAAGLRSGPLERALRERIDRCWHALVPDADGGMHELVRITELFPASAAEALPLRAAFILAGFAPRPRLRPYHPAASDLTALGPVAQEATVLASWGPAPGRQLMRLLSAVELLSRVPCHLLEVGRLEETLDLIDDAMEGAECP